MRRNFDLRASMKERRVVVRVALGILLAANLVAAVFVFHPLGGSANDLAEEMRSKQRELAQQLLRAQRTRNLVSTVQQAKVEGDHFLDQYTLRRRKAFSTLIGELNAMATSTGMLPKESSYVMEPVEGSDTIEQLSISANYEGQYQSLTKFINLLDRSPEFLIIDSLQASPQPSGSLLVNLKLDTFIRDMPGGKS